ncbi:MAG: 3-deoxy-manno-octulosonate cytidylyltransferase [Proteobacteria bacterium]|nr:3-deoxy-manno-octulosonate cytidylyltransferase [Pseudomonadota bacterium]
MKTLVVIPARLESTRLPQKALADICGKPMIEWVLNQAKQSAVGDVVVATCGPEIANVVEKAGGRAIITDPALPSGTDRVWAAYVAMGKPAVDVIIGLQGDLPLLNPNLLRELLKPIQNLDVDMVTLGTPITDSEEITNPNVVKIVMDQPKNNIARAIYFSRAAVPVNRPKVLEAYVNYPPCYLEQTERLEQLRFLQHGFRVDVAVVDSTPVSVDTLSDLHRVRAAAPNHQ